jgi:hypothetical protein
MRTLSLLAVAVVLAVVRPAAACTRDASATLQSAFDSAAGVVLGEVVSGSRTAASSDPAAEYPMETVTFRVLHSWKGISKPGSTLTFRTEIGPGSCGLSIDPQMRSLESSAAKKLAGGGIWILFFDGRASHELQHPSGRIGDGAERDLGLLYELGSTNIAPPRDARAQLLALHEEAMRAHRESNPDLLLRAEAPDSISANRGELTRPTLEERRARFKQYLGTTRFTEYVDVVPPVVRVSQDGSLGWVIVQVRASGVQTTQDGGSRPLAFESAWIELYERRGDSWYRVGNVSNFKP